MAAISQLRRNIDTNVAAIAKLLLSLLLLQAKSLSIGEGIKNCVSVKTQPKKLACLAWEPKKWERELTHLNASPAICWPAHSALKVATIFIPSFIHFMVVVEEA